MAFVQLRGAQVKDTTIFDKHIAANAAIAEAKLAVDWENHYHNALKAKKVVDFVQVNSQSMVSGNSILDVTSILSGKANTTSDPLDVEGVIAAGEKNKVPFRDNVTGDPVTILDANGVAKEVYGRMVYTPEDTSTATPIPEKWEVKFYYKDATNAEVQYSFDADRTIDFQYAQRFNMDVVDEMFAANEKFVEAAADASAHLNIQQLAKDLYGSTWSLDRDGNANLASSLSDQIKQEITDRQNADSGLQAAIDQEILDRKAGDQKIKDDLLSTTAGFGASLVGVEVNSNYAGTNVQAVLNDLASRMTNQEQNGGAEVTDTHTREVATLNGYFAERSGLNGTTEFATLEDRLEDIENVADARFKDFEDRTTALETEIANARISNVTATPTEYASVDARLEAIEQKSIDDANANSTYQAANDTKNSEQDTKITNLETYVSAESDKFHVHKKHVFVATGGETTVSMPSGETFQIGDDTLDVFVNGALQAKGHNYSETADSLDATKGIAVDFGTEQLAAGDILVLKYVNNNATKTFA